MIHLSGERGGQRHTEILVFIPEGKGPRGRSRHEQDLILNGTLMKLDERNWTGLSGFEQGKRWAACCEHGNEHSGSIKCWKSLYYTQKKKVSSSRRTALYDVSYLVRYLPTQYGLLTQALFLRNTMSICPNSLVYLCIKRKHNNKAISRYLRLTSTALRTKPLFRLTSQVQLPTCTHVRYVPTQINIATTAKNLTHLPSTNYGDSVSLQISFPSQPDHNTTYFPLDVRNKSV